MYQTTTSTCSNCGKHADKRCAKCRSVGYCSRECQVADFKKHKALCGVITAAYAGPQSTTKSVCEDLKKFPLACRSNPLPLLSSSCKRFPLEQLVPFFHLHFLGSFQCVTVMLYSPLVSAAVSHSGRKISLILDSAKTNKNMPTMQSFVSYGDFRKGMCFVDDMYGNCEKKIEDTLMKAYLMLCFHAKCNQVASCFGLLVLKTLYTHQFTYEGERIIGWAIQDGALKLDHRRITGLNIVHMDRKDIEELLIETVDAIQNESKLPPKVKQSPVQRNTIHVWLTFAVESGRIFDLDLSALQFGNLTLNDCIAPVVPGDTTAFHGMCDRDRLLGVNLPSFEADVNEFIRTHADNARILQGPGSILNEQLLKSGFEDMIDNRVLPYAHKMVDFAEPTHFWNIVRSLPSSQSA
jgi:hypothetical protein